MPKAIVSTKYQIVIPKQVRGEIGLKAGQTVHVIAKGGVITLVPDRPAAALRGFLKGMKVDRIREKKDRV